MASMHVRVGRAFRTLLVLAAGATACSDSAPVVPSAAPGSATSSTGDTSTGSVTTPRPLQPATNALVRNQDQPVTLVVQNALVTKPGGTTYTFEVATDVGFGAKVQTKDGVAEGAGGQTSVKLDALAPARDYYWRTRATGGGTTGVFGTTYRFTVGPAVVINAPVPSGPLTGASTGTTPLLTVTNATHTGPTGTILYKFEIATSASFSPVAVTGTVSEGTAQTTFAAPDLGFNRTYFWRATATDQASQVSSPPSATQSFTTSLAIDLSKVVVSYRDAPPDIASWLQTAQIVIVEQDGNEATGGPMCIGFQLSHDWPSIGFLGDPSVPVYANQWYFANIGGQWYGGPGEYLRADRVSQCKNGQTTRGIGPDGAWTGPMATWVPKVGELVGYMISTPARNYSAHRTINERSNIVVQPWRDTSLGSTSVGRPTR